MDRFNQLPNNFGSVPHLAQLESYQTSFQAANNSEPWPPGVPRDFSKEKGMSQVAPQAKNIKQEINPQPSISTSSEEPPAKKVHKEEVNDEDIWDEVFASPSKETSEPMPRLSKPLSFRYKYTPLQRPICMPPAPRPAALVESRNLGLASKKQISSPASIKSQSVPRREEDVIKMNDIPKRSPPAKENVENNTGTTVFPIQQPNSEAAIALIRDGNGSSDENELLGLKHQLASELDESRDDTSRERSPSDQASGSTTVPSRKRHFESQAAPVDENNDVPNGIASVQTITEVSGTFLFEAKIGLSVQDKKSHKWIEINRSIPLTMKIIEKEEKNAFLTITTEPSKDNVEKKQVLCTALNQNFNAQHAGDHVTVWSTNKSVNSFRIYVHELSKTLRKINSNNLAHIVNLFSAEQVNPIESETGFLLEWNTHFKQFDKNYIKIKKERQAHKEHYNTILQEVDRYRNEMYLPQLEAVEDQMTVTEQEEFKKEVAKYCEKNQASALKFRNKYSPPLPSLKENRKRRLSCLKNLQLPEERVTPFIQLPRTYCYRHICRPSFPERFLRGKFEWK